MKSFKEILNEEVVNEAEPKFSKKFNKIVSNILDAIQDLTNIPEYKDEKNKKLIDKARGLLATATKQNLSQVKKV